MNISSRVTDPFLASLTNPTELARKKGKLARSYPMVDQTGRVWPDLEAAYRVFKTGDTTRDEQVMVRIIRAKLEQHPELAEGITARGGVAFLERCNHFVGVKNSHWEGWGRESRFIRCLIAAYQGVGKKRVLGGRSQSLTERHSVNHVQEAHHVRDQQNALHRQHHGGTGPQVHPRRARHLRAHRGRSERRPHR